MFFLWFVSLFSPMVFPSFATITIFSYDIFSFIVQDEPFDWYDAQSLCQQYFQDLASIHSRNDSLTIILNRVSSGLSESYCWIGLNEIQQHGNLVWTDGTISNYTDWAPGQPNDNGTLQDCTVINAAYSAQWNDGSCEENQAVQCALCNTVARTAYLSKAPTALPSMTPTNVPTPPTTASPLTTLSPTIFSTSSISSTSILSTSSIPLTSSISGSTQIMTTTVPTNTIMSTNGTSIGTTASTKSSWTTESTIITSSAHPTAATTYESSSTNTNAGSFSSSYGNFSVPSPGGNSSTQGSIILVVIIAVSICLLCILAIGIFWFTRYRKLNNEKKALATHDAHKMQVLTDDTLQEKIDGDDGNATTVNHYNQYETQDYENETDKNQKDNDVVVDKNKYVLKFNSRREVNPNDDINAIELDDNSSGNLNEDIKNSEERNNSSNNSNHNNYENNVDDLSEELNDNNDYYNQLIKNSNNPKHNNDDKDDEKNIHPSNDEDIVIVYENENRDNSNNMDQNNINDKSYNNVTDASSSMKDVDLRVSYGDNSPNNDVLENDKHLTIQSSSHNDDHDNDNGNVHDYNYDNNNINDTSNINDNSNNNDNIDNNDDNNNDNSDDNDEAAKKKKAGLLVTSDENVLDDIVQSFM